MTQDEIIEMAMQVGGTVMAVYSPDLIAFAKLVAQHTLANIDPSKFISFQEGVEAGRLAEREACAKVCDDHCGWTPRMIGSTIRARGQA